MSRPFVHLHGHTKYSALDGLADPMELAMKAKEQGSPALCVMEHGTLASAIQHHLACQNAGIKTIFALEQDETDDRTLHSRAERAKLGHRNHHLGLIAKTAKGWENIIKISSDASTTGFFERPRTDLKFIRENNLGEGVICLSGCMSSRFARFILEGKLAEAHSWLYELRNTFEDVYLELQAHDMVEQQQINYGVLRIYKETAVPLVITRDYHYVEKGDADIHDLWITLQPGRSPYGSHAFYLAPPDEIELFCQQHQIPLVAMDNTINIAQEVEEINPLIKPRMPRFFDDPAQSEVTHLRSLVHQKLEDLLLTRSVPAGQYLERLEKELWVIQRKGYAGYFLVLEDLIRQAKHMNILVGPGRGSAAGSLVSYLLGITGIDPLQHDLIFERFLNPQRVDPPDIDVDVDAHRRHELIEYLIKRYGEGHVAQVANVNTCGLKMAVKDALRAMDYTPQEAQVISNMIPKKFPDQTKVTLTEFLDVDVHPEEYIDRFGSEEQVKPIADMSRQFAKTIRADHTNKIEYVLGKIEGLVRSYGVHAGGIVISPAPLYGVLPYRSSPTAIAPVTQWDLNDVELAGGLKLDLLGISSLSVIRQACESIGLSLDDINRINLNNPDLYKPLANGHTHGLFQADGGAVRQIGQELEPESFDEVIDLLSLARPGPMDAKMDDGKTMVEHYISAKNTGRIDIMHPDLDEILRPTKGAMIYQEQIMSVCQKIAGYTMGEADLWRRAVAKKKRDEILKLQAEFMTMATERGYDADFLTTLLDGMVRFAGYSFNKSHAAAYAMVLAQMAFLKIQYPAHFMAATMTVDMGDAEKLILHLGECRRLQLPLLPPDINSSLQGFSIDNSSGKDHIRFGLQGLKGVGPKAMPNMLENRPYTSLEDFVNRTNSRSVKRDVVQKLILVGAFDQFEPNRYKLLNHYFFDIRDFKEVNVRDKGPTAVRMNESAYDAAEKLKLEKEYMGVYITDHPAAGIKQHDFHQVRPGREVRTAGLVESVKKIHDRKGKKMCFLLLDTPTGMIDIVVFSSVYKQYESLLRKGDMLLIQGKRDHSRSSVLASHIAAPDEEDKLPPLISLVGVNQS